MDIAAQSETRLSEEGKIEETGSGYTFFWEGKNEEERRIQGFSFAIKTPILRDHHLTPTAIKEQLMTPFITS